MNHSKETKIDLELLEDLLDSQERSSSGMKFKKLIPMIVLNWQYFLFSFIIFVSGAILYLRYTEPTYKLSARMLIKDDQKKNSNASQLLTNMMDLGFVTNSSGIDNEVEVMQSRILMRDVVRELHLNADFRIKGHIMDKIVYRKQAVNVELDPVVLDSLDKDYMEWGEISSIQMEITRKKRWLPCRRKIISSRIRKEKSDPTLSGEHRFTTRMYQNKSRHTDADRLRPFSDADRRNLYCHYSATNAGGYQLSVGHDSGTHQQTYRHSQGYFHRQEPATWHGLPAPVGRML